MKKPTPPPMQIERRGSNPVTTFIFFFGPLIALFVIGAVVICW